MMMATRIHCDRCGAGNLIYAEVQLCLNGECELAFDLCGECRRSLSRFLAARMKGVCQSTALAGSRHKEDDRWLEVDYQSGSS